VDAGRVIRNDLKLKLACDPVGLHRYRRRGRLGTELEGRPDDEFGVGYDISDDDEHRRGQEAAWPSMEGRMVLR